MSLLNRVGSSFTVTAFALLLAGIVGSGCAVTKDQAKITYIPQPGIQKLEGADAVTVKVTVDDVRTDKTRVSCKKNGYGMEMAAIVPAEDVAITVKRAMETEFAARGFVCAESQVNVAVEIVKFWNDFKVGFFAGDAIAEVMLNVSMKRPDGTIVFHKTITASGKEPNIQMASGGNAEKALAAALRDATEKLFNDSSFVTALMQSKAAAPLAAGNP